MTILKRGYPTGDRSARREGKAKDPEKWNATQNEYAKHFYKDVLDLLAAELKENETHEKRLHELVTAYKKAPRFLAGLPQDKDSQPSDASQYLYEGIEISKYKTAGLNIRFSDLGIHQRKQSQSFERCCQRNLGQGS